MAEITRIEDAYNWNLTQIANAFGLHRDTVRKRLLAAGVVPAGTRSNASVYALRDVGPALFAQNLNVIGAEPDELPPTERRAWYQSENERVKLEIELRELVRAEEVHQEMSRLAKAVASGLDSLSDMLERDAGLHPEAIILVEKVTDNLREQMYQSIINDDEEI
jgi:DNA-binding transcriptional regulator PaaX